MKKSSMTLLSLIALTSSSFGDSAASFVSGTSVQSSGTHQFSEGGLVNNLVLCTYELCHLDENGSLKITPVAAGSTSAIISQASVPGADKYLVFYPVAEQRNPNARRILRNRYMLTLADGATLEDVQQRCGIKSARLAREGSNVVVCEEESAGKVLAQLSNVKSDPGVASVEPIFVQKRFKRAIPTDPFYDTVGNPRADEAYQWYLNNIGVNGASPDIDINVEEALDLATGRDVTVGVIDDGLATDHTDLVANAVGPHLNLLDGAENDPTTLDATLTHGTSVAALIGAAFNNGEGISGVAPEAELSGIRLLAADGTTDDADEALALSFSNNVIDIYNASWGPDDTVLDLEGPGPLTLAALRQGVQTQRFGTNPVTGAPVPAGLGSIYVWAAGDGGAIGDNSNYDGYANAKQTIAVGSVTDAGLRAPYSERGANLVVVAPSDGGVLSVLTASYALGTDDDDLPIRIPTYETDFGGTSASAALVSGVVALMLEENPNLSWRDVQDILIRTAKTVVDNSTDWETNAAGLDFSHDYGAGLVDAAAAVREAAIVDDDNSFLGPVVSYDRSRFFTNNSNDPREVSGLIPDTAGSSLLVRFDMSTDEEGNERPNLRVEHVELNVTIITESRSDLEVILISPNGTQSIMQEIAPEHEEQSIRRWNFMTVRNWGEGSSGAWTVRISDGVPGNAAILNNATLLVNGSVDPDAPINQGPILTSSRSLNLDEGTAVFYELEAARAEQVSVGDLPPGLVYDPGARTISGTPTTPGLYPVPIVLTDAEGVSATTTLNIVVRPTAVALGDAIGFDGIPAFSGGDLPWDFEFTDTNDGNDPEPRSARSAVGLPDNNQSIFGFRGVASGVLYWDWKTSSEEGGDRLWFNRGGDVPQVWDAFISGERLWDRTAVYLPDASNTIQWIYTKNASGSEGEDRGLVDNLELVSLEKYREDIYRAGNVEGLELEFDSRTLFLPVEFPAGSVSPGGPREMLRSSTVGNGQTVSLAAWVNGPGVFSFRAFNLGEAADVFEFLVDGVVVESRAGAGAGNTPLDILNEEFPVPEGRHRLQMRYRKDFRGSEARVFAGTFIDGILLDDIVYRPTGNDMNAFISQYGSGFDPNPDSDSDGDGYTIRDEYAFGGNPLVADIPKYLPRLVDENGNSFIEFGVDPNRSDLTYEPQQSADLLDWQDAELATLNRTEGDYEIYRIPVTSAQGRRQLFYRVVARNK